MRGSQRHQVQELCVIVRIQALESRAAPTGFESSKVEMKNRARVMLGRFVKVRVLEGCLTERDKHRQR